MAIKTLDQKDVRDASEARDWIHKRAIITRNPRDCYKYKRRRNVVVKLSRESKRQHYENKIDEVKSNSRNFWSTLKELIGNKNTESDKKGTILLIRYSKTIEK